MKWISLSIFLVICCFAGSRSHASWATAADADYSSENEELNFDIHKDGTYEVHGEHTVQILKESARASMGVVRHYYDPQVADFKFIKGETINEGKEIPVEKKFIEDKPLASGGDGFDTRNQLTVVFPDVKVGSKIHEIYTNEVTKVPVPNFFSQRYYFGFNEFEKEASIHLKSEMPLFLEKNDPLNKLDIIQKQTGSTYEIDISLKSPLFTRVMHEKNSIIDEADKTWVAFSNVKNFSDVLEPLAKKYEEITASALPPEYQAIVEKARLEKTPMAQMNSVTSQLAELVRYVGDWREIKGAYEPHTLANIAATKFGDCKDFAVSTAAMLRKLGFQATVVATERGRDPSPLPNLPLMSAFNHAMVRLMIDGKVRWLDPTNFQSFSQGMFEDVSDRDVLVLEPGHIRVEHTSKLEPKDSEVVSDVSMNFFKDGDVALTGFLDLKGRAAIPITGARLYSSEEELSYQIATSFFPDQNLKEYSVEGLALTSRIVKDTRLQLRLRAKNTSLKTTAGSALRLPDAGIINAVADADLRTRVSDLEIDSPETLTLVYRLDNVRLVGHQIHGCELKSPWINAELKISQEGRRVIVKDTFVNHTTVIKKSDLETAAFKTFQDSFKNCFENVAVVYQPTGKDHVEVRSISSESH